MIEAREVFWALTPDGWRRAASVTEYPAGTLRMVSTHSHPARNLENGVTARMTSTWSPSNEEADRQAADRLEKVFGRCPYEDISDESLAAVEAQLNLELPGGRATHGRCWDVARSAMLQARWLRGQVDPSVIRKTE